MNKKSIVIASDSFKGSLSSLDICSLFKKELEGNESITAKYFPIADGGEGSLDAISMIKEGKYIDIEVKDLYMKPMRTRFYVDIDNNAYIETASCVGLTLAKGKNSPGSVTTYGLGEQIKEAIRLGYKNIYIFLGGSASNDGGVGLASALGTKFYNDKNNVFVPNGLTLKDIKHIDNKETLAMLKDVNIHALSDVKSPFYGKEGAAYKFAPQKGANNKEVILLDAGLKYLANLIKQELGIDISHIPGSGAAGGLGGGLIAFANASIHSGINTILDLGHFDELIKDTDLVISGEGKLDKQTFDGKVIDGVATRCIKENKPLYVIVGISETSLKDIKTAYPCIENILETNEKHLPFYKVKKNAKKDYSYQIKKLFKVISDK